MIDDLQNNGTATGYVGNRTLVVEPTKMANNAVIADASNSGA